MIAWLQATGQGHFLASPAATLLLFLAGPATVVPLALFAWAARRLPLSTLGFLQFLGPTIAFVIGVAEGEPFGSAARGLLRLHLGRGGGVRLRRLAGQPERRSSRLRSTAE